jgi:hypothetical protein
MHSELCIHPSHNFLEYALPFTFMVGPVPTIFILVIMQREKGKHIQRAHLCNAMAAWYIFLFNIVQSNMMSDTGFTCPKCDHSFPTAEQVAEHLRNEHVDGTQTESTKRMT